jgi:hypothetical protein
MIYTEEVLSKSSGFAEPKDMTIQVPKDTLW